ncbi:hypothetical protein SEMRO_2569_G331510.1 [Seminavis robusta]|uniref:Uncharacterized protein n=1 Tax=Seminavis robusta TaxID=568900 RepID=A0A9N8EZD6_9STRA|nr:hypothetical protein SEMRO_2569_G331510.1 [Seminavis robusta]|eukprot:Sro2569_g331510.1 n/a (107) ;mRNA; r:10628-10948
MTSFDMSPDEMRVYLQGYYGIPVALRRQGDTSIKCPYCCKMHYHSPQPGHGHHYTAACDEEDWHSRGIDVGDRYFVPNYGCTIIEYIDKDGVNWILPEDAGESKDE